MRAGFVPLLFVFSSAGTAQNLDSSVRACATDGSPTFFPRQGRWVSAPNFDPSPGTIPHAYYFDSEGVPGLQRGVARNEVNRAFDAYNQYECTSEARSYPNVFHQDFGEFDFEGQTLAGEALSPRRDRNGDPVDPGNFRYINVIRWVDRDEASEFLGGSQTLAVTTSNVLNVTQIVVQSDIVFNAIDFQWRSRNAGCTPSSTCHDIFSVALHEVGHYLGFGHVDCADAVMYQFNDGVDATSGLSSNETAGLCALYPPRNFAIADRVFGEQCNESADCASGLVCALEPNVGPPFGMCSETCRFVSDCPEGFVCHAHPDGFNFCRPGVDAEGSGGRVDPETQTPVDLCQSCSGGDQCSNGVCVATSGDGAICTQACSLSDTNLGCPDDFICVASDQFPVCVPQDAAVCEQEDSRSALNEVCYRPSSSLTSDEFFNPCGPGLSCFQFRSGTGACVVHCNAVDRPYSGRTCPQPSQRCCFGVDADGKCVETPPSNISSGGCFDTRRIGQSCAVAENAVCENGAICVVADGPNSDRCYRECQTSSQCVSGSDCRTLSTGLSSTVQICCDSNDAEICRAFTEDERSEVGVACLENDQCQSGLCVRMLDGASFCSRSCDPATAAECPAEDADVNGDGIEDGPFECQQLGDDSFCVPTNGAVLDPPRNVTPADSGCSCRTASLSDTPSLWLLLGWLLSRRVRRRSGRRVVDSDRFTV